MKINCKVSNPDALELEMTITMSLPQWKDLRQQLFEQLPLDYKGRVNHFSHLGRGITDMIRKADALFYPQGSDGS